MPWPSTRVTVKNVFSFPRTGMLYERSFTSISHWIKLSPRSKQIVVTSFNYRVREPLRKGFISASALLFLRLRYSLDLRMLGGEAIGDRSVMS